MLEKQTDATNTLRAVIQNHKSCNTKSLFIKVKENSIFINDVKIISKRAKLQYAIFKILINKYIDDFWQDTTSFISTLEIAAILESNDFYVYDCERQVRQAIHKIRISIQRNFKNQDQIDEVILSNKWKGYRLSEYVVLGKK